MNFYEISIQNWVCWNWLFSRIWILCIFTKCRITDIFRLPTAKRFHRNCWIWSATYEKWHHENCWRKYTLVIAFNNKKSATVQQRFTWFLVTDQESNLFLARAVAFLMFMFPCSLYDTDNRYDDTDDRNNNTDNAYHCFQHLMYLSIDFPSVSPPIILEALKMSSFWRKVNRLPFW